MGTIVPRKRKDGTVGYHAQISIARKGQVAFRETRRFDRRQAALAWIEKRQGELSEPGVTEAANAPDPTLSEVIDRYTKEAVRDIGRTKAQVLRSIKSYDIANMACSKIASADIAAFAQQFAVQPQTVGNDLSHLAAVFAIARPLWGYPLDQQAMKDALAVAKRVGITSKSRQRDRRPTLPELDKLLTHFTERQARRAGSAPMARIIVFALFSTRRLEEITRIRWADLDVEGSRVLVRDMKNPGDKLGNDVWCDVPQPAMAVIQAMPLSAVEIFPFKPDAISAAFTRACPLLGIEDLHFHDLRHEGMSLLFEEGLNIPHVAAVSGHRSWTSLKPYTHVRQSGDKYEGWEWLDRLLTDGAPI